MIYYLFGPDSFRSREKLKQMIAEKAGGFEVQEIGKSGDGLKLDNIKNKLATATLFSNKRFVIIEGLADKKTKFRDEDKQELLKFIKSLEFSESDYLIFWDSEVDKRGLIFKALKSKADEMYEFGKLNPAEMEVWITKRSGELGLNIKNDNRKKLAAMLGSDTWLANNELLKLKAYKGGEQVEYGDIDLLVRGKLDDDIFKACDLVAKGQKAEGLKLLTDQVELGNNELYVFSMLVRQFRILIQVKSALDGSGARPDNIKLSRDLGLHPFVVQKSLLLVSRYSLESLEQIYQKMLDLDLSLKSSRVSKITLLQDFVMKL